MDAVGFKCVELTVEQGPPAELDQALGPAVDQVAEARSLAGGKNNGFHLVTAAFQMRRALGMDGKSEASEAT